MTGGGHHGHRGETVLERPPGWAFQLAHVGRRCHEDGKGTGGLARGGHAAFGRIDAADLDFAAG